MAEYKPTREQVLAAVRGHAIHHFPRSGGAHASGVAVAYGLGMTHADARVYLEQLQREGKVAKLDSEDMWRLLPT